MTHAAPVFSPNLSPAESVLAFSEGFAAWSDEPGARREHLGGKGAGLAEMTAAGINVPPGFTIIADVCRAFFAADEQLDPAIVKSIEQQLSALERRLGRKFGSSTRPLLVSIRSGSKFSMPGMMDTVLNLGLNDTTVEALAAESGDARFAWDSYRRLVQMYGHVVCGIAKSEFDAPLAALSTAAALSVETLRSAVHGCSAVIQAKTGAPFPHDPREQLLRTIAAVFSSWNNDRAVFYRKLHHIDHTLGTAVTVQAMVFGNLNDRSATGVCFTRNPSTGEKMLYGEYLPNAQGEDVVAGIRTPRPIAELRREMPAAAAELEAAAARLEAHYRDVQDIEFTIQDGELFILQTRTGKRTALAAVKTAVAMAREGLISRQTALLRVPPNDLQYVLLPRFDEREKAAAAAAGRRIAAGLNASPGAAIGELVFSPDEAASRGAEGRAVILARVETCPDDIHGIAAARGVITARGGMTSHAAVVARGMGKPCIAGCADITVDPERGEIRAGQTTLRAGDTVSIDGGTGEFFSGTLAVIAPAIEADLGEFLAWADAERHLKVRANADTPLDAARAREHGAEGIGLCRTEHMFMAVDRLPLMRAMIAASDRTEREGALAKLLPLQRADFREILRTMSGLPVTIRLLDPPLHEFLPHLSELRDEIALLRQRGADAADIARLERLAARTQELTESNPMMGFRGCRLGLVYPEIYAMQVRAIFEAAIDLHRSGIAAAPEIMVPLIGHAREVEILRSRLDSIALDLLARAGINLPYSFGTMIEVPRACVTADEIARHVDFFSFGTNDLTQMTFGFSRDDAEAGFLRQYLDGVPTNGATEPVLDCNPFEVLDEAGVGALMRLAIERGRRARPRLKLGLCGEHGGEARSIEIAERLGLTYVSCSPFRIPIARLAAARAALARDAGETLSSV